MLHQLESGDWINLRLVVAIHANPQSERYTDIGPHVQVNLADGQIRCAFFNTVEGARQYRDDLARLAIAAQTEKAASGQG